MTTFTPKRLLTRETPKQILTEDFNNLEWPISGGWGYTQEDAVIIDADNSSSAISVENRFIEYKTYEELIIFRPKGQKFRGVKIDMRRQYLVRDDQGRSYDKIEYSVTALPEADFAALKADAESINELPDPLERMKRFEANMKARDEKLVTFETECWFDITKAFNK